MSKVKPVVIVMGSDSDLPRLQGALDTLDSFGVGCDLRVLSAHRTPQDVHDFAAELPDKGVRVVIAAAGGAAHLAGVIASLTTVPVIGVPIETKNFSGLDSLLSTVQMPAGVPVATVAIGSAGATNAALLAVQILALSDVKLARKLVDYRAAQVEKVRAKDKAIRKRTK
jgi:5-(carboxyamino)imidazole ribonucleotide mutase